MVFRLLPADRSRHHEVFQTILQGSEKGGLFPNDTTKASWLLVQEASAICSAKYRYQCMKERVAEIRKRITMANSPRRILRTT